MTTINDERFHELALRAFLNQGTPLELRELKSVIDTDPDRATELKKLNAEFLAAKELISLMAATDATGPKPSQAARERFRSKVNDHFKPQATAKTRTATPQPGLKLTAGPWWKRAGLFCILEAVSIGLIFHFCSARTHPLVPFSTEVHLIWSLATPWLIVATAGSAFASYLMTKRK